MFKYQWQEVVFNALAETDPKQLQIKVQSAEEVVAARLDSGKLETDEQEALTDAVSALRVLRQEQAKGARV